jgi:hypothetical protein
LDDVPRRKGQNKKKRDQHQQNRALFELLLAFGVQHGVLRLDYVEQLRFLSG